MLFSDAVRGSISVRTSANFAFNVTGEQAFVDPAHTAGFNRPTNYRDFERRMKEVRSAVSTLR